jgi:hypothetical protein
MATHAAMETLQQVLDQVEANLETMSWTHLGRGYRLTVGREGYDGAFTGVVREQITNCPKGSVRISPEGRLVRFPCIPKVFIRTPELPKTQKKMSFFSYLKKDLT